MAELNAAAPRIVDRLCPACAEHFAAVRAHLDALGIGYRLDPGLVRGLDYYTRTTFEFFPAGAEGQQSAIGGGGRYDGLVELLGGRPTPGIGFGIGLDRVVLALEAQDASAARRRDRSRSWSARIPRGPWSACAWPPRSARQVSGSGPSSASASSAGNSRRRPRTGPTSRSSSGTRRAPGRSSCATCRPARSGCRSDRRSRAGAQPSPRNASARLICAAGTPAARSSAGGGLRLRYAGHDRPTERRPPRHAVPQPHLRPATRPDAGSTARLSGWVHRRRDHGQLIFLDLRDRHGITQVVVDAVEAPEAHQVASRLRNEFVVTRRGRRRAADRGQGEPRPADRRDRAAGAQRRRSSPRRRRRRSTSTSPTPRSMRALRLKYRYLDIRREPMQRRLLLRTRLVQAIREVHHAHGFVEVETPDLIKSTPEGARDFIVPEPAPAGHGLRPAAEPAAAQAAAHGRRHRPLLPDRPLLPRRGPSRRPPAGVHPARPRDELRRRGRRHGLRRGDGHRGQPGRRPRAADPGDAVPAIHVRRGRWSASGRDKPDLRFGMELVDLGAALVDASGAPASGFRVFDEALAAGGRVKAIVAPGHGRRDPPRDRRADRAGEALRGEGPRISGPRGRRRGQGPDREVPRPRTHARGSSTRPPRRGDLILIVADAPGSHRRRPRAGSGSSSAGGSALADPDVLAYCWVHRFPMYQWDAEGGRWDATHNPFSGVVPEDEELLVTASGDPSQPVAGRPGRPRPGDAVRRRAQRLGARRRLDPDLAAGPPRAQLRAAGPHVERMREKFGAVLEAFDYGPPPHGGIAIGIDRWAALLARQTNIREVMAFPKTQSGTDLMLEAPSPPDPGAARGARPAVRRRRPEADEVRPRSRGRRLDSATPPGRGRSLRSPRPRLAALLGAMCIAFSGIFYRCAEVSPSTGDGLPVRSSGCRCWSSSPTRASAARADAAGRARSAGADRRASSSPVDLTFWHHAIGASGRGLATVLGNLQVLIVGVVALARSSGSGRRGRMLLALPVVLAGVVLISGVVGGGAYGADPGLGVVLGLLTALCLRRLPALIRRGGRDLRRPAGPVAIATLRRRSSPRSWSGSLVGDLDLDAGAGRASAGSRCSGSPHSRSATCSSRCRCRACRPSLTSIILLAPARRDGGPRRSSCWARRRRRPAGGRRAGRSAGSRSATVPVGAGSSGGDQSPDGRRQPRRRP